MHRILDARVRCPNLVGVAAPARVAVEVILLAANTANATLVAMKNLLLHPLVVPEIASLAKVSTEIGTAGNALPRGWLSDVASRTDHLRDPCPVDFVRTGAVVCLPVVVAVSAPKGFAAARGDDTASPLVVLAALCSSIEEGDATITAACCS